MPYNKERLLKLKEHYAEADRKLSTIREPGNADHEKVAERLKEYLMTRLLLTETDTDSSDLKTMIDISLKKQEELLKAGIKLEDVLAPGCAGITGAAAKKIFLLLTIQNLLSIQFDEMKTPYIETIDDLSDAIISCLQESEGNR